MLFCTFLTARLQRETFNWDIIVEDVNTDFFCSFFLYFDVLPKNSTSGNPTLI